MEKFTTLPYIDKLDILLDFLIYCRASEAIDIPASISVNELRGLAHSYLIGMNF
jgi:hypothetical protein